VTLRATKLTTVAGFKIWPAMDKQEVSTPCRQTAQDPICATTFVCLGV